MNLYEVWYHTYCKDDISCNAIAGIVSLEGSMIVKAADIVPAIKNVKEIAGKFVGDQFDIVITKAKRLTAEL